MINQLCLSIYLSIYLNIYISICIQWEFYNDQEISGRHGQINSHNIGIFPRDVTWCYWGMFIGYWWEINPMYLGAFTEREMFGTGSDAHETTSGLRSVRKHPGCIFSQLARAGHIEPIEYQIKGDTMVYTWDDIPPKMQVSWYINDDGPVNQWQLPDSWTNASGW